MNPLLQLPATPHETFPFPAITLDDYQPAIAQGMAEGRAEIAAIAENPAPPTFANTILALEQSGELLGRATSVLFNLNAAETSPEMQEIVKTVSPLLTEYGNDITLNATLFDRIKTVYDQRESLALDAESQMLLEKTYKRFARNGANLTEADKTTLRSIDTELAQLSLQFGENILNETNDYVLTIEDETDLRGLPDFALQAARQTAAGKGLAGWAFTLQAPSYGPFMQYAENRALRETLYRANSRRGFGQNQHDNQANISRMVHLRHQRATLLGYPTHAEFVLEESMAGSAQTVTDFLAQLLEQARPAAHRQLAELTDFARRNGFGDGPLQHWDYSFYAEKLRKEQFDLDDETLRPYFPLNTVLAGAFDIATQLFGITFVENTAIPVYHPQVRTYEVYDADGAFLAVFYGDYFPRPGKRNGAWMSEFRGQRIINGHNQRPHILNVCNFTPPVVADGVEVKPSLLTFYEVTTLFHEFGHALHGMLANGQYESLTGTNVPRDFVELPSQLMENWCYLPEALTRFARHYQTQEVIPQALVEKIRASQNFMAGIATLRQLRFGLTDMRYHGQAPTHETVTEIENRVDSVVNLFPPVPDTSFSTAFSHIFAGGYSAGYYSYKWSEVLDADAFEYFREQGGLSAAAVAGQFRQHVLARGGSEKPMALYKKFRGREPSPQAMLRRSGLLA